VVRHAGPEALSRLEPLLVELRTVPDLVEKKSGAFYKRSKAFLHFHEDPSGLHVDVRLGEKFERYRVETLKERAAFLRMVRSNQ
jgi:hypothetical protein